MISFAKKSGLDYLNLNKCIISCLLHIIFSITFYENKTKLLINSSISRTMYLSFEIKANSILSIKFSAINYS